MPARKTSAAKATAAATPKTRERGANAQLPQSVTSVEAAWPGSNRGGGSANAALKAQLAADVLPMTLGSTRAYPVNEIGGKREINAFVNLFRKVTDETHGPIFGVQSVVQGDTLYVRLGNRRGSGS